MYDLIGLLLMVIVVFVNVFGILMSSSYNMN